MHEHLQFPSNSETLKDAPKCTFFALVMTYNVDVIDLLMGDSFWYVHSKSLLRSTLL